MKQEQLSLYTVNIKLIRNMHNQGDDRVFSVSPQTGKDTRPFVGLIVVLDNRLYCIPLSSPKEKHRSMKNGVDFHRILDSDGKLIGVLDFNNMIPVRQDVVKKSRQRFVRLIVQPQGITRSCSATSSHSAVKTRKLSSRKQINYIRWSISGTQAAS